VLGVTSMAFGANGQNFILGSLNNAATAITKLTGTVGGGRRCWWRTPPRPTAPRRWSSGRPPASPP
jgi:hypothetical protein